MAATAATDETESRATSGIDIRRSTDDDLFDDKLIPKIKGEC